jgi:hypothetical protein
MMGMLGLQARFRTPASQLEVVSQNNGRVTITNYIKGIISSDFESEDQSSKQYFSDFAIELTFEEYSE